MFFLCWIGMGKVFVPTVFKTVDGLYVCREPLDVLSIDNSEALRATFRQRLSSGNTVVPRKSPDDKGSQLLLKKIGSRSWSEFERQTTTWSVSESDGVYELEGYRDLKPRGREIDPETVIVLPTGTSPNEVCARFVSMIQAGAARTPMPAPKPVKLQPLIGEDGRAHLPDGERNDEVADTLEWIVNDASAAKEADMLEGIRQVCDDKGDPKTGRALRGALAEALKADISQQDRLDILKRYERYTRLE